MKNEQVVELLVDLTIPYLKSTETTGPSSRVLGKSVREAIRKHAPELEEPFSEAVETAVTADLLSQLEDAGMDENDPLCRIAVAIADGLRVKDA